jgi:arabinose-5-phosphate isomerase
MRHSVIEAEIAAIRSAARILDTAEFQELTDRLWRGEGKLIVTGIGKSAIAARKIAATCATCNIPAVFVDPVGLFHGELGLVVSGDIVLMLSNSGETEELVRLIPPLREKNCSVFSLVGRPSSTLGNQTHAMVTGVETEPFLKVPTASSAAAVAIGDALAIEVARRSGYNAAAFARNHPGGHIGRTLQQELGA